jgi:hypothetical protein
MVLDDYGDEGFSETREPDASVEHLRRKRHRSARMDRDSPCFGLVDE